MGVFFVFMSTKKRKLDIDERYEVEIPNQKPTHH